MRNFRKIIDKQLGKEIDRDYVLLDIPDYRNIGDQLIYAGEREFLNTLSFKNKYSAPISLFDNKRINNELILLQGGGNFGDLWEIHQKFREKIIRIFKKNKIILFPQTVNYESITKLRKTSKIFGKHKNLLICARDKKSYHILKTNFKNRIILVPDMALYLKMNYPIKKKKNKILFLCRTDKELDSNIDYNLNSIRNMEVKDWPTFEYGLFQKILYKIKREFNKIIFIISKTNFLKLNKFLRYLKLNTTFNLPSVQDYLKIGRKNFSQYDLIVTNRLHGFILAINMGIPSILLDNSYGKNKNFYKTWIVKNNKYPFVKNKEDLIYHIKRLSSTLK